MEKSTAYSIEYQQFNFKITAKEPLILPAYKGSILHGGLGNAFKRVICAVEDKEYSPTYFGRLFCRCYQDRLYIWKSSAAGKSGFQRSLTLSLAL
jgi:hypothetical protein